MSPKNSNINDTLLSSQSPFGSRRAVTIVDPVQFDSFFSELKNLGADLETKALIGALVSTGGRISEVLGLQVCDIDQGNGFLWIKVSKKKKKTKRKAVLHPVAKELIEQHIAAAKLRHFDKLFRMARNTAYLRIRRLFGDSASCHTIGRHSHITFLLEEKKFTVPKAARLLEMSPDALFHYSHTNTDKDLAGLFGSPRSSSKKGKP